MPVPYKAKICGTTNLADARLAADAGADFFGAVMEVGFSPRSLTIDQAEALFTQPPLPGVALVHQMAENRIHHLIERLDPFAVQFLGDTAVDAVRRLVAAFPDTQFWQSVHLPPAGQAVAVDVLMARVDGYLAAGVDALLLDTAAAVQGKTKFGGTGLTFDWRLAGAFIQRVPSGFPVWLAGGINPDNVRQALEATDPFGIDLCSGVEASPGKKDPTKVNRLMDAIRAASAAKQGDKHT